jgi:tetratricopeptide (TPR) repeat protein
MKPTLDADEYFHLALHASSVCDPHACISYLEEVLQQQPANARAMSGINEALAIEPALEIARFHLGLLLLFDRNRHEEAKQSFLKLFGSADQMLRSSAEAMAALADNDIAPAREMLALGVAQAAKDQALSAFMKQLLDHLSGGAPRAVE